MEPYTEVNLLRHLSATRHHSGAATAFGGDWRLKKLGLKGAVQRLRERGVKRVQQVLSKVKAKGQQVRKVARERIAETIPALAPLMEAAAKREDMLANDAEYVITGEDAPEDSLDGGYDEDADLQQAMEDSMDDEE